MARFLINDKAIQAAEPKGADYKLNDGGGLFLLVKANGAKLWRYRYKLAGKENLYALGEYSRAPAGESEEQRSQRIAAGFLTLAEARIERDRASGLVAKGIHPAHHRQGERQRNIEASEARKQKSENSFERAARAWLEDGKGKWAAGTHRAKKARVEKHLLPALGELPLEEIGVKTLRPLLLDLKGGAWTAVHIKGDLSGIFDFAILRGWCESNPVYLLRSLVEIPRSENKAALQAPQLREFFKKLAGYRGWPETALALRLILLTAARPGEVAAAEWSEIDFEARLWRRPAAKMKARVDHISPLSEQAFALLQELRAITGNSAYLVPRRDGTQRPIDPARFAYAMRDLALAERASPHCFRATFSTWANERGFRPDAIEKQLAHVPRDVVRAAYDRSLLIEERRTMMQAWADYLSSLEAENVIVSHFGRAA